MRVKDRKVLADYMKFRRLSYAQLAEKIDGRRINGKRVTCSKATIGHLITGKVQTTSIERAQAIEEALEVPTGTLFVANVSRVSENAA